jgi:hypothetical protein
LHFKLKEKNLKLSKLQYIEDLKIPIPEDLSQATKVSYIRSEFEKIQRKFKGKYEITHYHWDVTFKDSELSTLMQIVDDSYSAGRRKKIFSE